MKTGRDMRAAWSGAREEFSPRPGMVPHPAPRTAAAFTLIEIMIVVGIIAIVMTVAIPAFVSAQNKRPMRAATEGLMEACATARAQAILRGTLVELRIRPQDYTFDVTPAGQAGNSSGSDARPDPKVGEGHAVFHVRLPEEIGIEELAINFQLLKEAEADIMLSGGRSQFVALKAKTPWLDINQERHHAYAGYDGMVALVRQIAQEIDHPIWAQVRRPAPWEPALTGNAP